MLAAYLQVTGPWASYKKKDENAEIVTQEKKKSFISGVRNVDENSLEGEIYFWTFNVEQLLSP